MKTPREILTEKHKAAGPKLDAIRRESAGQASRLSQNKNLEADRMPGWQLLWHNLFLPSRRIWAGLATVWIVILAANVSMRDHTPATMAKSSSSLEMAQTFKQRQQLLAQLIGPNDPTVAEPQKTYTPRPSSLRPLEIMAA